MNRISHSSVSDVRWPGAAEIIRLLALGVGLALLILGKCK